MNGLPAGAGLVAGALAASWLASARHILETGRGFDIEAVAFLGLVASALVLAQWVPRIVAGVLAGLMLAASLAWLSMVHGEGSGHGPLVLASLGSLLGAKAVPRASPGLVLIGFAPLAAAIYHGDPRPIAESRPWIAMMGDNTVVPAAVVAAAWLLSAANHKAEHRTFAQAGTLVTALILVLSGWLRLQPDEDPSRFAAAIQTVSLFALAFFTGMNGWKSIPAATLLIPVLAVGQWLVVPMHNSEAAIYVIGFNFLVMPAVLAGTAAIGAWIGQAAWPRETPHLRADR